jgi:hypothetical protein
MPYTITWSPTARITYLNILEYVEDNWTHKEVNAFVNQTEKVLKLIRQIHFIVCQNLYPL